MLSLPLRRLFGTAGHNKAKKITAQRAWAARAVPRSLPWYINKEPVPVLKRLSENRPLLEAIKDRGQLLFDTLVYGKDKQVYVGGVLAARRARRLMLSQEERRVLDATPLAITEAFRFVETDAKAENEDVYERIKFRKTPAELKELFRFSEEGGEGEQSRVVQEDGLVMSKENDGLVVSKEKNEHDELVALVKQEIQLERRPADEFVMALQRLDAELSPKAASADFGLLLVRALMRENRTEEAWVAFRDFNSMRAKSNVDLIAAGIELCGKRKDPERALILFEHGTQNLTEEQGNDPNSPYTAAAPVLYHPTMRALAQERGTSEKAVELYYQMTKVDSILPSRETLAIMLKACSVRGDVIRAKMFWREMVDEQGIVPDHLACELMLHTLGTSNRLLRAKTLKPGDVRLTNFQDLGRLALTKGWQPAPIHRVDEAREAILELEGLSNNTEENAARGKKHLQAIINQDSAEAVAAEQKAMSEMQDADWDMVDEIEAKGRFADDGDEDDELDSVDLVTGDDDDDEFDMEALKQLDEADARRDHRVPENSAQINALAMAQTIAEESLALAMKDQPAEPLQPGKLQNENIEYALVFFQELQEKYQLAPRTSTLNSLVKVLSSALRLNRAMEAFSLYETFDLERDSYSYGLIIAMFARAQRLDKALEMLHMAEDKGKLNRTAIGAMVDALARHGRQDEALDLVKKYKDDFKLQEKYVRFLRIKVHGDEKATSLLPRDPNAWRARELIRNKLLTLQASKDMRKTEDFLKSSMRT